MRRRLLLSKEVLEEVERLTDMGVPLAKVIRDSSVLDMSQPSVAKLLKWYKTAKTTDDGELACIICLSLFPGWATGAVHEQPDGIEYKGYWPLGTWT